MCMLLKPTAGQPSIVSQGAGSINNGQGKSCCLSGVECLMYLLPSCSLKLLVHTDGDEEQPLVPQPQVVPQPNVEPQQHVEPRPLQSMMLYMHV